MKIIRFLKQNKEAFGNLHEDNHVTLLEGDIASGFFDTGALATVEKILAPILPSDILCIGLNYKRHATVTGVVPPEHPILFLKNTGSLQHPEDPVILPRKLRSEKVDYECELAVVLGKRCHNVSRDEAHQHILGYTCANDISARDWQKNGGGGQWCRGKTSATFCPLGPVITTPDEIKDPNKLSLKTILNGQIMQEGNTDDMIFNVPTLIEFLSASTVLNSGTVILTGTPHGVGFARTPPVYLQPGDEVTVEIEGIGRLTNPVIEETDHDVHGD